MIDIEVKIRRRFWQGISSQSIEDYLKELIETTEKLQRFRFEYTHYLFGGKLLEEWERIINREISYCRFYQEYTNRQFKLSELYEPNLNQWVFKKKEEAVSRYDWIKIEGEQWTKTNGKVRATIQFDRSGLTVKITLGYENDSRVLEFLERESVKYEKVAHLRNEDSIRNKVNEFMAEANSFLKAHELPRYEGIIDELRDLNALLCITEVTAKT